MIAPSSARWEGFTLVELLVVLAIVAILAALLLPVLSRVQQSARGTKCLSNLRQIAIASQQYSAEHANLFPAASTWPDDIYPYVYPDAKTASFSLPAGTKTVYWCPAAALIAGQPLNHNGNMSYSINGTHYQGLNRLTVGVPETMLFAFMDSVPQKSNVFANDATYIPVGRHPGGVNVAYADSHMEFVTAKVAGDQWNAGFYGTSTTP